MIYIYVDSQRIQHYSNVLPITSLVQIEDGGSLEIGSSDCPFEGRAEILLTGEIKTCLLSQRVAFQAREGLTTRTMERSLLLWKQAAGWRFMANNAGWQFNEMRKNDEQHRRSWTQLAATVRKGRGPRRIEVKRKRVATIQSFLSTNFFHLNHQHPRIGCKLFSFLAL